MATLLRLQIAALNSAGLKSVVRSNGQVVAVRLVEGKLRHQWSPEQIAGWLVRDHALSISHERVYQHIRADRQAGGL